MAIDPALALPGTPTADPGWLETITPLPEPVPPAGEGGAKTEPASRGPPRPPPLFPLPCPESGSPVLRLGGGGTIWDDPKALPRAPRLPPEPEPSEATLGGGGTTLSAERTVPRPPAFGLWPRPPPVSEDPGVTLGGGGTI
jgi:hypothetical protein